MKLTDWFRQSNYGIVKHPYSLPLIYFPSN